MTPAPQPGEPLVVRGVSIPWDPEHSGWFLGVPGERVGIERYQGHLGVPCYRYLRTSGAPWTTSEDLDFSIRAMEEELRKWANYRPLFDLLLALKPS